MTSTASILSTIRFEARRSSDDLCPGHELEVPRSDGPGPALLGILKSFEALVPTKTDLLNKLTATLFVRVRTPDRMPGSYQELVSQRERDVLRFTPWARCFKKVAGLGTLLATYMAGYFCITELIKPGVGVKSESLLT